MRSELTTHWHNIIEVVGLCISAAGVLTIVVGVLIAVFHFVGARAADHDKYRRFRVDLGRGILLGLEFLVAADIIETVAVEPTLNGVLVLGLIVLVRTFLSMTLQVELDGCWPWQRATRELPESESKL